ncbi:hypothetical protein [Methanobacterium alcaliphilum]|uniref:hypothetical protein n=1 Tax=Methanobacterium alcaliphilum TaxID=392018 RepID=UPI00200B709D|nr:hypothetical protein [Methanobacterium alcaliphilum]MCK9151548.1 hypothetical protein [Methanobacterium alcaliphilum]
MSYARSGYGVFKKKTVKVEIPGNLTSENNVIIIDYMDFQILKILFRGIRKKEELTEELWNIVQNNDSNVPFYDLLKKHDLKLRYDGDEFVLARK